MSYGSSDLNGFGKNSNVCKLSGRYDFKESFDWMIFKSATKIVTKRLMSKKVYIAIPFVSISDKATKIPSVTKNMTMM